MVRALRYPRLCLTFGLLAMSLAMGRDYAVGNSLPGLARVLLTGTVLLLALCLMLLSCRFIADENGVSITFLLRVRRVRWENVATIGMICCNGRRPYLYGMYKGRTDFMRLLYHAPWCGPWGFVVPLSRRLITEIDAVCPYNIDLSGFSEIPRKEPKPLRAVWQHAALYDLALIPAALLSGFTAAMMLQRACDIYLSVWGSVGLSCCAAVLVSLSVFMLHRALLNISTCPRVGENGVAAGWSLALPWEMVRYGYIHRRATMSGMFLLSRRPEELTVRSPKPVACLSLPDSRPLMLSYLTYCPNVKKNERQ